MRRRRAQLAVLLVLLATACHRRWQETHELGSLRLTQYWGADPLDWEGGNTYVSRETLCRRDGGRCVESRRLVIQPETWRSQTPRWIVVDVWEPERPTRFFDTRSGNEIVCAGCDGEPIAWRSKLQWAHASDAAIARVSRAGAPETVAHLRFDPAGISLREIELDTLSPSTPEPSLSPDGRTIAWLDCRETCALVAFDIASARRTRADTGCPPHDYLVVAWKENAPLASYYWGAGLGSMRETLCRDSNGALRIPIGQEP